MYRPLGVWRNPSTEYQKSALECTNIFAISLLISFSRQTLEDRIELKMRFQYVMCVSDHTLCFIGSIFLHGYKFSKNIEKYPTAHKEIVYLHSVMH